MLDRLEEIDIIDGQKEEDVNSFIDDCRKYSLDDFPRLVNLRNVHRSAEKKIFTERATLLTDYLKEKGRDYDHMVLQKARGLHHVLEHIPTPVFEDELIAGSTTKHRLGCLIFPEMLAMSAWPELPLISKRKIDPIQITEKEIELLAEEVFPFWKDDNMGEYVRRQGNNPRSNEILEYMIFYMVSKTSCLGHIIPNYQMVVDHGLKHMIQRAKRLEQETTDEKKREFYMAVQIAMEGVVNLANRYADQCDVLSENCSSERRMALSRMADNLRHVPALPARTFHQALQSIWITLVAIHQESLDAGISFGRLDQILYPYYQNDIKEGILDDKKAAELIGCFFIKLGDHAPLVPSSGQEILGGSGTNQALTIGGMKSDGTDGVNELTYLMLKVSEILALREPNVGARLHSQSPPSYFRAVTESLYNNGAVPALYNDDVIVESLTSKHFPIEDARNYGIVGCVEQTIPGCTMSHTGAILLNLVACLELALYDGIHPLPGIRIGPSTGEFNSFATYKDFYNAFIRQVENIIDLAVDANTRYAEAHRELHPTPLLSALIEGTFESGKDITDSGARYNTSGAAIIGFADVVDSLLAIKQLVFDERRLKDSELMKALQDNFEGHEKTHALLSKRALKYGTDNNDADALGVELVELIDTLFARHNNPRGGKYHVGYWSMTLHTGLGKLTGALPNGKRKQESLSSGITPCSSVQGKGPTASLSSTSKLPCNCLTNGIANNHKVSKTLLKQSGKLDLFEKLIKGYFKKGGMQVQFIIQDTQTLIDALENPDAYKDLLVRVSGYTAYFNDLTKEMKEEIIARVADTL